MPLTDVQIRNAKPGLRPTKPNGGGAPQFIPTDKPYKLADAKGLYLEVDPAGGKYWRLKYRHTGKEKRISLGVYPEVTRSAAQLIVDCGFLLLPQPAFRPLRKILGG